MPKWVWSTKFFPTEIFFSKGYKIAMRVERKRGKEAFPAHSALYRVLEIINFSHTRTFCSLSNLSSAISSPSQLTQIVCLVVYLPIFSSFITTPYIYGFINTYTVDVSLNDCHMLNFIPRCSPD